MAATVAMFKLDGKLKLMRAAHARTRTQATVERGDWVWTLCKNRLGVSLSLIHISEPTRLALI
eukprot:7744809-Alexandrium_andersonii.AAC.1